MAMEFLWEFFKIFDQNTLGIMLGIQFFKNYVGMEFLWEFFKNFDQNTSGIMLGIQFGSGLTGTLGLTYVSRYSIWDGTDESGYRSPSAGTSVLM